SVPKRTETSGPSGHVPPKRLEPQRVQKAFAAPCSGPQVRISSSPCSSRNRSRGTRPWVRPFPPECLRQREQWHVFARRNGGSPSYRTEPHRQPPPIALTVRPSADRRTTPSRGAADPAVAGVGTGPAPARAVDEHQSPSSVRRRSTYAFSSS